MGEEAAASGGTVSNGPPKAVSNPTGGTEAVARAASPPVGHGHGHHPHIEFKFFEKLKQRNVVRVALLYLVACWLILEPTHVVFHMLEVPAWANRLVLILMAIGLPAVMLLAWAFEITPEGLKPTVEVDPKKSIRSLTGRRLDRATIVVLVLALGYFVADKFWLTKREAVPEDVTATPTPVPSAPAANKAPEKSIAVLPFVDMSEKKDQEYFSDGLAEELIDQLAKVPQLHVIARTSAFSFKGKSDDIPTIARKLNVANILEGSVRKSGVRLRVTTQLVQADSGQDIWSETYDQELKDVFKVQDEIAGAVVAALKVHLLPSKQSSASHRTDNIEAFNQYLLGRQFANRRNVEDWRRATKAYRKAIELDPGFAAAYAGLSESEFLEGDQTEDTASYDTAMASAEKAVKLAPDQAEGYAARASLRTVIGWDWVGAEADLQKALALDPGSVEVQVGLAEIMADMGRIPEAIAVGKHATELDPLSSEAWGELAWHLYLGGQYAAASEANGRSLEIAPDHFFAHELLGYMRLLESKPTEAASTFAEVKEEGWRLNGIAMAEHSLGHIQKSQEALDGLIARHAKGSAFQVAEVYAWRHEKDKAFEWLDRAYRQRDAGLVYIKGDPFLASLHGDPRFGAFLRKMKLPE
jgi:adenylate cyclase